MSYLTFTWMQAMNLFQYFICQKQAVIIFQAFITNQLKKKSLQSVNNKLINWAWNKSFCYRGMKTNPSEFYQQLKSLQSIDDSSCPVVLLLVGGWGITPNNLWISPLGINKAWISEYAFPIWKGNRSCWKKLVCTEKWNVAVLCRLGTSTIHRPKASIFYCFPRALLHSWSWLERYSMFSQIVITESTKHWENILKWINSYFFPDQCKDTIRASHTAYRQLASFQPIILFAPSVKTSSFSFLQSKLSCQDAPQAMIYMPAIWEGAHTCRCSSLSF